MKVLFAVSSESISENIIKKYQKEYKEILSYKNVYYFNAILKEIQKDKTYDRIVISEDLEPFSNNNYDTIDKFIFEKLDSISDEAQDVQGKDISIILICTDRRVKGNSILVKLFGIGVYNALLGEDRKIDEVCKLISRPRTKKDAKMYYQIDTDDVNYKAESENEVSEVEIQNILAHFKKLGKNTSKYADSFNNIAVQYTDEQLKIIVNCLPINVKAVLESNCERYQQLMAVSDSIHSVRGAVTPTIEGTIRNEINERSIGQAGKITKPIVIPSAVKNAKTTASPVIKKAPTAVPEKIEPQVPPAPRPVVRATKTVRTTPQVTKTVNKVEQVPSKVVSKQIPQAAATRKPQTASMVRPKIQKEEDIISEIETENILLSNNLQTMPIEETSEKRGRGRPRKTPVGGVEIKPKGKRGRPKKVVEEPEELDIQDTMLPGMEEDYLEEETILPGMEDEYVEDEAILPGMEDEYLEDEAMLPGMEDEYLEDEVELPGMEEEYLEDEAILPGMEDEYVEDEAILPGMEEEYLEDEVELPGMEEEYLEDEVELPGMEEEYLEDEAELPGMEEEYLEDEAELPGMEEEYLEDEVELSGMEEEYLEDEVELPEMEEEYLEDEVELPEMDSIIESNNDLTSDIDDEILDDGIIEDETEEIIEEDILEDEYTEEVSVPGLDELDDDIYEEEFSEMSFEEGEEEDILPGFTSQEDDEIEEETLLPGMGFEDEYSTNDVMPSRKNNNSNYESNSLESIKPRVDYSMSSLNSLITKDKKIVTFIGTSKNGTSFLVNNLAALFSSIGINTAILDMTQNKNSYYIYTKNEEELRNIAYNSIEKLQNGYAEGIRVDKNLTVYTSLPNDGKDYSNAEPILSTLVQNHSLVLIDCDYDTDISYFASCQEMYLVQSMDILTIQPLTAFLRELKTKGVLEPEKIRVVINKELKVRSLSIKAIVGGISYYNDPAMSFMTELFNKDIVKTCTIPFEDNAYSKYLEGIVNCSVSLNGYSKAFLSKLKILGDMVYPLTSKQSYNRTSVDYNKNAFSSSMNDTLNKMRKKY